MKDLGILISHDLKWSAYVSYIKANAYTCCYRILKSFSTRNIWILLKAFVTYVRPKIEYNTSIWSPHFKKDITSIESVQKLFTRAACNRCNIPFSSYADQLNKLNLKSLEYRRLEFDLILVYKICYKLIDIAFDDFFLMRNLATIYVVIIYVGLLDLNICLSVIHSGISLVIV